MSRIAVIAHAHHPIAEPFAGGLEMHTHLLVEQLSSLGHDVVLFAHAGSDTHSAKLVPNTEVDYRFIPFRAGSLDARRQVAATNKRYQRTMALIEDDGAFDYVINNSLNREPLRWLGDTPMLTIFHTPFIYELETALRVAATLPNRAFITVSETTAREWRQYVPNVEVVHNGINLHNWRSKAARTSELRWSARITPEKGLHVAIEAARLTGRNLKIAGPISDQAYFDSMIAPQLDDNIQHVGHLDHEDLAVFISEGAVALATPQWEEPFGLSVVEAFACGVPVAALPRGAMAELIHDNVGAVATNTTAGALAVAIERAALLGSAACRTYANSAFSARSMVNSYMRTLDTMSTSLMDAVGAPAAGQ